MSTTKRLLSALVSALVVMSCGGDILTTPTPEQQAPPEVVEAVPTPSPTPTPALPASPEDLSYVVLGANGGGQFCRQPKGGDRAYLTYTAPMNLNEIYGYYTTDVPAVGECVNIPPASTAVRFQGCGDVKVQVDANQQGYLAGRHMGHVFITVKAWLGCCKEKGPHYAYGEAQWDKKILDGLCKVEVLPLCVTKKCHQVGTQKIMVTYDCKAGETQTRDLCRNVECRR